jgi:hypothetical protein
MAVGPVTDTMVRATIRGERLLQGVGMDYQRPAVVRREPMTGLLTVISRSDADDDTDTDGSTASDLHMKDNVLPVAWSGEPYEAPAVADREAIAGLARLKRSSDEDEDTDSDGSGIPSDRHIKDNVVAVGWSGQPYQAPAIADREPVAGLLIPPKPTNSDTDEDTISVSDVHAKDGIVPVRWTSR